MRWFWPGRSVECKVGTQVWAKDSNRLTKFSGSASQHLTAPAIFFLGIDVEPAWQCHIYTWEGKDMWNENTIEMIEMYHQVFFTHPEQTTLNYIAHKRRAHMCKWSLQTWVGFHFSCLAISSLLYHPKAMSLKFLFFFSTVRSLYLTNRSCQDMNGYTQFQSHDIAGWSAALREVVGARCLAAKNERKKHQKTVSFWNPQHWNSLANWRWLPSFHWRCNHSGTCNRPPFLGSQRRLSFAFRLFSSSVAIVA